MTATKTRKTRSSKAVKAVKVEELLPVEYSVDTDGDVRPEPIIKRSDYVADIKIRWMIHQYEVKKLGEDITQLRKYLSEKTSQFSDMMFYTWSEM